MVLFNKTTNITRVLNAALEIEKKKSQKSQQQQASSIRKRKGGEDEKNKIEIDEKQQATTNEDKNNNNKVDKAAEEKRKKQQESESKKQQLQEASQMTAMPSAEKKKLLNLPTSASTTTNITLADESLSPLQLFEKYADDNQPAVSFKALKLAVEVVNNNAGENKEKEQFHKIIAGSALYFPPKPVKKKSPEAQALFDKLQKQYEERLYSDMVKNVTRDQIAEQTRDPLSSYKNQLGTGVDILLVTGSLFIFGYFLGNTYYGESSSAMILGTIFGIGGLLVETFLLINRMYAVDKMQEKNEGRISAFGVQDKYARTRQSQRPTQVDPEVMKRILEKANTIKKKE